MKEIGKVLANLLKVKSIISLAVILTTCYLTIKGSLEVASFMTITGAIITYYFTKDEKKETKEVEETILEPQNINEDIGRYG